jgi:hypothetical protein
MALQTPMFQLVDRVVDLLEHTFIEYVGPFEQLLFV